MELLKEYQADIMLVLSGICGVMALFVYMTTTMTKKRRMTLMLLELSAMFVMIADRRAYIYRGDPSTLGWWMVRISNFMVFFLMLVVIFCFNRYLGDLLTNEGGLAAVPKRLKAAQILSIVGMAMVIISQFTGFYYTFDESNRYQRAPGFVVCYLVPLLILILQISVVIQFRKNLTRTIWISLLLFSGLCIVAAVIQLFMYGVSLNQMAVVFMSALLYVFALKDMGHEVERARNLEIDAYKEGQKREHTLFEQTAEALASAIDAKDEYTKRHSSSVAFYSTKIAQEAGKSEEECEKVYFAALLHDVGKIGVPDSVINKDGRLTDEEFAEIKKHPVLGNQILSSIQQSPYLSIGAHHHHERYDGRGYPDGLKGNDIPEIARIISVADAYDAMTSKRSYRDPLPQQTAREELVKGIGTQFDPEYAKIMIHLIDLDIEYQMREMIKGVDDVTAPEIHCERIYDECTLGIWIKSEITRISFYSRPDEGFSETDSLPTLVLFDALDARIHEDEAKKKDLLYFDYAQIRVDGKTICEGARKIEARVLSDHSDSVKAPGAQRVRYAVEAVRVKDHALIRISDGVKTVEYIIAMPDSARFSYISLTGEHCQIDNIQVEHDDVSVAEDYIPRIAEEVSFIRDCPQGDIPNIQIDGWRSMFTEGVPLTDSLKLTFHAQSLPTARLVWHCPFVSIYTSADGTVDGDSYREFLLLRLDGETWESDKHAENELIIDHTRDFQGWNAWRDANKQGIDCEIQIKREGSLIRIETENQGIAIYSRTTIKDDVSDIYVALTGDQCTVTNIKIGKE